VSSVAGGFHGVPLLAQAALVSASRATIRAGNAIVRAE
jgi:hypothetical protein